MAVNVYATKMIALHCTLWAKPIINPMHLKGIEADSIDQMSRRSNNCIK
jgi:hypothetical protein